MQAVHDTANPDVGTEAVQAEAIVEALQSQLWAGSLETEAFLDAARLAAESRGKAAFEFKGACPQSLHRETLLLLQRWNEVPSHGHLELHFSPGIA